MPATLVLLMLGRLHAMTLSIYMYVYVLLVIFAVSILGSVCVVSFSLLDMKICYTVIYCCVSSTEKILYKNVLYCTALDGWVKAKSAPKFPSTRREIEAEIAAQIAMRAKARMTVCMSVCRVCRVCLSAWLSACMHVCLTVCVSVCVLSV